MASGIRFIRVHGRIVPIKASDRGPQDVATREMNKTYRATAKKNIVTRTTRQRIKGGIFGSLGYGALGAYVGAAIGGLSGHVDGAVIGAGFGGLAGGAYGAKAGSWKRGLTGEGQNRALNSALDQYESTYRAAKKFKHFKNRTGLGSK